jgi:hypothetical protein
MKKRVKSILNKTHKLIESYTIGEDTYSPLIDDLISELIQVKNELKRGKTKKFFRKEASRIQSAIQSLRYLKKRSEKMIEKEKVLISESELLELVDNVGMLQVEKINITRSFSGTPTKFISGMTDIKRALTPDMSWKNDAGTAREVYDFYVTKLYDRGRELSREYMKSIYKFRKPPSLAPITTLSPFILAHFYSPINTGKYIIATYDDPPAGAPTPPNPATPGVGWFVEEKYQQQYSYNQMDNLKAQVNGSLNVIVKGFNAIFRGISDIPDNVGYDDSTYASKSITADIINLTGRLNVFDDDARQVMNKIILKNISEKQSVFFTIDRKEKLPLQRDSIKRLAKTITKSLLSFYINELENSKIQLKEYFENFVIDTAKRHTTVADPGSDADYIITSIEVVIQSLKSIEIKN